VLNNQVFWDIICIISDVSMRRSNLEKERLSACSIKHVMKTRSGGVVPRLLNLGTTGMVSGLLQTPSTLRQGKRSMITT